MTETIHFYEAAGPYACLSNFARYPIKLDGRTWPTTEHYFQAQKSVDPAVQSAIRKARTPHEATRLGRDRELHLRPGWDSMRIAVMEKAVAAKFGQHEDIANILLETTNAKLVEHTHRDRFWADGGDGSGKNHLGRILMQVRDELRRERGLSS